jgi:hypothetical protein
MSMAEETKTREKVISSTSPSLKQEWTTTSRDSPPRQTDEYHKRAGQVWPDDGNEGVSPIGIAELPDTSSGSSTTARPQRSASNVSATLHQPFAFEYHALSQKPNTTTSPQPMESEIQPTVPLKVNTPIASTFNHAKSAPASNPKLPNITSTTAPIPARKPAPQPNAQSTASKPTTITENGGWAAGTGVEGRPNTQSRTQRDRERKKKCKAKVLLEHVDVIKDEFWEKRPWILSGRPGVIFP